MSKNSRTVIKSVRVECPDCMHENILPLDMLDDEELWYNVPFELECEECHGFMMVEIDDDDR